MTEVIKIISSPFVNVKITNNLSDFMAEKRYDKSLSILELKGRLELITGASANAMTVEVYDESDKLVCMLSDDGALLGSCPIEENYRLHVTDCTKTGEEFIDTSKVEKYELSDEAYNKKSDSVRAFLRKNKLGKYNEEEQARITMEKEALQEAEEGKLKSIHVGDRCEVRVLGEPTKRGVVMFIGKTHFKSGLWVGVKYDEPLGKNDGSIDGKRYFDAPRKYGGFVNPSVVEVGDFPEISYDDEDEM